MLREAFEEVMTLQPAYTAKNLPPMQRRSVLVRQVIPRTLVPTSEALAVEFGVTVDGIGIDASDGVGQKTAYCWVRIYAKNYSPNPQTGWYIVFLFSAGGERVALSLNQGTTTWNGSAFVPQDRDVLLKRVAWARNMLIGMVSDPRFSLDIDLGGSSGKGLGRGYEAGHVIGFTYEAGSVPGDDAIATDVLVLGKLLGRLYNLEDLGRVPASLSPETEAALDAVRPAPPPEGIRSGGQGRRLSVVERRAVEAHAMGLAKAHLETAGWSVKDTSMSAPYDFIVTKDGIEKIVEVKGTTGAGDTIVLTRGEVRAHKDRYPNNALIIVHSIDLERSGAIARTSGGVLLEQTPWHIEDGDLKPLTFELQTNV